MSHLVCVTGDGDTATHVATTLTCSMHLLSGQLDVEGVGGVPPTCQSHTQLWRGHTQHLLSCLAKVRLERISSHAPHRFQGVHLDLWGSLIQ